MFKFICGLGVIIFTVAAVIIGNDIQDNAHQVKKLDPAGNTWFIWADHEPTRYIDKTCVTIGRSVEQVILVGGYGGATQATVKCGE